MPDLRITEYPPPFNFIENDFNQQEQILKAIEYYFDLGLTAFPVHIKKIRGTA